MPAVKDRNKNSKTGSVKGKEKEVLLASDNLKKPDSQLKKGWTLQPISVTSKSATTGLVPKQERIRSPSPRKKRKVQDDQKQAAPKGARVAISISCTPPAPIEILDSDEDEAQPTRKIRESVGAVASTSKVTLDSKPSKVAEKQQSTPVVASVVAESSSKRISPPATIVDIDNEDEEERQEDESFASAAHAALDVKAHSVPPIIFDLDDDDDDDIELLEDRDEWEDSERIRLRRRGKASASVDPSEFGEGQLDEDPDLLEDNERGRGGGDSDEDILELMERGGESPFGEEEDPFESSSDYKGGKLDRISATPDKATLRPLTSILRRSISPAVAKTTIDTAGKPNAFTALMQGNNIDKQWASAAESENAPSKRGFMRPAPFYKILEGMRIAVDAFKYGKIPNVDAYFLSHAHSDHYTNLSSSWTHGPIYCSVGTANLIKYKLGVKDEWVKPMPFDKPFEVAGCTVTLIDANHCPGSSIFVFEGPQNAPNAPYAKSPKRIFRYLHCGDFRASPTHLHHPAIKDKKFDICYLDTTYLNPKYCFPAQEQVIDACAELVRCRVEGDRDALKKGSGGGAQLVRQGEMLKGWLSKAKKEESDYDEEELQRLQLMAKAEDEKPKERLLVMVGTYSIGKERIVKGIARAIGAKIYCDQRKREIFACHDDPELMSMVTDDPLEGQIHVTWLGQIKVDNLSDYLDKYKPHFSSIVGLRPTGWTFKPEGALATTLKNPSVIQMLGKELQRNYNPSWMTPTKDSTRTVEAYGVPYSEHSSFAELTCFAVSFDCVRFIPTVNVGSKTSRDKMQVWFEKWAAERKRRKANGDSLMIPHRTMSYW